MHYDVVIIGGGPGGLAAALTLGRSRRNVLLLDGGPRRNATATHIHNFVTRDGTPPEVFRRLGREQLAPYGSVEVRDQRVETITGEHGAFTIDGTITARRILLCTGMVDRLPAIEGTAELWGRQIFICPYCHGWEVQDRLFAYIAAKPEMVRMALLLRGWSKDVAVLTNAAFALPSELRAQLTTAKVHLDERAIARLEPSRVVFTDGESLAREIYFMHPEQRQVPIVTSLGLELDAMGYVKIGDMRETSRRGIYAAGDLVTPMQAALGAAAAGSLAAGMLNHELTIELALAGAI